MPCFQRPPPLALHLEEIQERRGAQQPVALDARPTARLRHVKETGKALREGLSANAAHQVLLSMMFRKPKPVERIDTGAWATRSMSSMKRCASGVTVPPPGRRCGRNPRR